jgi:hypothetical protein
VLATRLIRLFTLTFSRSLDFNNIQPKLYSIVCTMHVYQVSVYKLVGHFALDNTVNLNYDMFQWQPPPTKICAPPKHVRVELDCISKCTVFDKLVDNNLIDIHQ